MTLSALPMTATTIVAGGTVQGTATLNAAVPTGGLVVTRRHGFCNGGA